MGTGQSSLLDVPALEPSFLACHLDSYPCFKVCCPMKSVATHLAAFNNRVGLIVSGQRVQAY